MRRFAQITGVCALLGAGVFWWLTRPDTVPKFYGFEGTALMQGDVKAGRLVFAASGCASCHAAPDATGEARLALAGGTAFPSEFGTFYAPNISMDIEHGIGGWTFSQFANAVIKGVSPEGAHYYPAFPYTAYTHMTERDAVDLWAYMQTLPADATASRAHEVGFPFNIRRGLGLWKALYVQDDYVLAGTVAPDIQRGRYLVEGLAHCGACHTPRSALGGLDRSAWLTGAPDPSGKGVVPGITPATLDWSEAEITEYLTSGFTPDYDSAGGKMAEVVENMAQLPDADRAAIAAYLKSLP